MRISWLSAEQIAAARQALTAGGATWDDHFEGTRFASPAQPAGVQIAAWEHVTEHVARAERVSEVVREAGLDVANARFAGSGIAIEAATLAAAAHESGVPELDRVLRGLACAIDTSVFS